MKLASIVPVSAIDRTFEGSYAMCLAHIGHKYPMNYNGGCYVIMDNSLIELGGAVDIRTVVKAADDCMAWVDEIVLPDVFQKGKATIRNAEKGIKWLRNNKRLGDYNLMAVAHGRTESEFKECFAALESMEEIKCIGIPKVTEVNFGARYNLEELWQGCKKEIHLLGVWSTLDELREYKHPENIRSVDTCIPALKACRADSSTWSKRPDKTIDLMIEEMVPITYEFILKQLAKEGIEQ